MRPGSGEGSFSFFIFTVSITLLLYPHFCLPSVTYLGNPSQRDLVLEKVVRRNAQLFNLLGQKPMRPLLGVVAVFVRLPDRAPCDLLGELFKRLELLVQWRVLAGGLQAIGEDIPRS